MFAAQDMPMEVYETHSYQGPTSIVNFITDEENRLSVTIDTRRLQLKSVVADESYYASFALLFGDPEVMCKYASGATKTREYVQGRIDTWSKRFGERDPYSGFAVFKKDTQEFIGHLVLGHGDNPGESEIAFLFLVPFWNQGYGSEAVFALVNEYAPATVREGFLLEGKMLEKIYATAREDNVASVRIMQKVGMKFVKIEEKHGAIRHLYEIDLKDIIFSNSLHFLGSTKQISLEAI